MPASSVRTREAQVFSDVKAILLSLKEASVSSMARSIWAANSSAPCAK
jgi:hypothetical protein